TSHHQAVLLYHTSFSIPDTSPTDIYTLSLHDALPISPRAAGALPLESAHRWSCLAAAGVGRQHDQPADRIAAAPRRLRRWALSRDRKSTRLNSSHQIISYAVFCLKKKTIKSRHRE